MMTTLALPRKQAMIVFCYVCNKATVPQYLNRVPLLLLTSTDSLWQAKVMIEVQSPARDTGQKHWRQDQKQSYCPGLMSIQELQLEIGLERKLPTT